MKNSNEQTIKEVIQELLDAYRLSDGLQETRLVHSWDKVAGEYVARNTESAYIKNKVLFIKLKSPALKNELSYAKTKLIESLNKAVNQEVIQEIVFL